MKRDTEGGTDEEKANKYDEAIETIQKAAEATEDEERKARLVESRKEVARVAVEEIGIEYLTGK